MSSFQVELFEERKRSLPAEGKPDFAVKNILASNHHASIENSLNSIFLEPKEETKLFRARRVLGDIASGMNDDDLISSLAQFQHLLESWFDDYEKIIFKGKTLNQILNGG